jgi:hypothetical protein
MGLDTTHGCWNGAYSSFNTFRHNLANQIGINLDDYRGYGGEKDLESIEHGIMPLLNHSDCDGSLSVEESKSIAEGLSFILDDLTLPPEEEFNPYNLKFKIERFRNGLLDAIENDEIVEFH